MFIGIISAVAALYLFFISFMMDTRNFQSTFVFKMVPFLIGLALTVVSLKDFNIV